MPVERETETVEVVEERTTTRYICDAEACEESTEWCPEGDPDVANPNCNVGHSLHYVSLDPHPKTVIVGAPRESLTTDEISDRHGVYLCEDHIHLAGELLEGHIND